MCPSVGLSVCPSVLVLLEQLLINRLMRFDETLYQYFNTDYLNMSFRLRVRFLLTPHIYYEVIFLHFQIKSSSSFGIQYIIYLR